MGISQKPINPTFELENVSLNYEPIDLTNSTQKKLLHKLLVEFEQKKIYLNSQLNIMDLVEAIGTNRTYISLIINQNYNQNFCSFVNSYRVEELERVLSKNRNLTIEVLAEMTGFGSVNSLKRAVYLKAGKNISEWKKQLLK